MNELEGMKSDVVRAESSDSPHVFSAEPSDYWVVFAKFPEISVVTPSLAHRSELRSTVEHMFWKGADSIQAVRVGRHVYHEAKTLAQFEGLATDLT